MGRVLAPLNADVGAFDDYMQENGQAAGGERPSEVNMGLRACSTACAWWVRGVGGAKTCPSHIDSWTPLITRSPWEALDQPNSWTVGLLLPLRCNKRRLVLRVPEFGLAFLTQCVFLSCLHDALETLLWDPSAH